MSRLNSFKQNKSKNMVAINKDGKFLAQKRSEKAREARMTQFDRNRDIAGIQSHTNNSDKAKPNANERAQELMEWKKKKGLEKQNKINKKPFLPSSGPGAINRISLSSDKTLHNSLTSNSSVNRNSTKQSNPVTSSIPNSRVTRSQMRREKEEQSSASSLPATKPTLLVDEQELAWIPESDLGDINLKVLRKSLRFSDIFSKAPRSPFAFKASQPPRAAREPTILETSIEVSPIPAPSPTVSRNLIGAFSLLGDDTELLAEGMDSETIVHEFEMEPSESSKEATIQEHLSLMITSAESQLSEAPQRTGIDLYSHLLQSTTEDLMSQRDRWQGTLNTLTEACDNIRSAIGHTDLLLNKKFPQYSGLIRDATDNPGQLDLQTRCSDLQGFWDLILREVEGMQAKYSKLIRLAENGYQAVKSTHKLDRKPRRIVPRPKKESTHVSRVTRASSASLREQMMRGREQLKEQQKATGVVIMAQEKAS